MGAVLIAAVSLALLVLNEAWWRRHRKADEISRKFVHIVAGSFVASWPFYLSWNEIRILSFSALVVVLVSKYFKLFRTIHTVTRPTWGEAAFALAAGSVTFITHSRGVYAVALLQMALADGLAAVAGMRYGKPYEYKVFGHTKSLVGTGTFIFISYLLLLVYSLYSTAFGIQVSLAVAVGAAFIENIAVRGLDNLLVPVLAALVIRLVA